LINEGGDAWQLMNIILCGGNVREPNAWRVVKDVDYW